MNKDTDKKFIWHQLC